MKFYLFKQFKTSLTSYITNEKYTNITHYPRGAKSADFSEKCWFWDVKSGKIWFFSVKSDFWDAKFCQIYKKYNGKLAFCWFLLLKSDFWSQICWFWNKCSWHPWLKTYLFAISSSSWLELLDKFFNAAYKHTVIVLKITV